MSEAEAAVATPPRPKLQTLLSDSRIAVLLAVALASALSTYMVIPFMAIYFHSVLGFGDAATGFLVSLPFLSGLLFGMLGGIVADRWGIARTFAVAMVIQALAFGALAFTHVYWAAALLLVVSGVASPLSSNGPQALANRSIAAESRGALQNYLYWVQNGGVMVGLLVAAELLDGGRSATPFLVMLGVRLAMAATVLAVFGAGDREARPAAADAPRPGPLASLRTAMSDRALLFVALAVVLVVLMESQLSSTVPLRLIAHIAHGNRWYGPLMAIDSVVVVAFQPLAMRVLPTKRPYLWFALGALATGAGLAVGGLLDTLLAWAAGMVLYSLGEVVWAIRLNDLIGELPRAGMEGLYFSTVNSGMYLGSFVGMTVGGTLLKAPVLLYVGMLAVALAAAYSFRRGGHALRLRVVRDQAEAGQVVRVSVPGVEAPAEEAPAASAGEVMTPGMVAAYAPREGALSDFGIPASPERMVLLADLAPAEWERLLGYTTRRAYAPGETVIEQGAVDRSLYVVESGSLDVLVQAGNGEQRRLTVIEPGAVFGEQAFIDGAPRSAAIRGRDGGVVRRLEWEAFHRLAQAEPELARRLVTDLARILSERLRLTTAYLNTITGG